MRELETSEYGALPLPTRLGILGALVQLALDGPSVRAALEAKLEEAARVRKAMAEDAKVGQRFPSCGSMWRPLQGLGPAISPLGEACNTLER